MWLAIVIVVLLALAVGLVLFTGGQRRAGTGALSRETRSRDASGSVDAAGTELELAAEARSRSEETKASIGGTAVATRSETALAEWTPADEEQLGVSRRQFFNRALLTVVAIGGLAPFGAALLAFLWPFSSGGFGGKVVVGKVGDILAKISAEKTPFYSAEARTYLIPYPADALPNAKDKYDPIVYAGMEKGLVALYQKCVHLGCRVPWCGSAQWFECPCHGSKYNKVGEKRDGPAPRGLDHWPMEFSGDTVIVNTGGTPIQGPPIGTDSTGQKPEGAHCV